MTIGPTYGGGFFITPDAVPDDGLFDVCMIDPLSLPEALVRLPFVVVGKHTKMKPVHMSRALLASSSSATRRLPAQIDGEVLLETRYEISILPGAIECIVPRRQPMTRRHWLRQLAGASSPRSWAPTSIGSIPFAYIIVQGRHRRGHHHARHRQRRRDERAAHDRVVGLVRVAMLADGLKGLIPTLVAKAWAIGVPVFSLAAFKPWSQTLASVGRDLVAAAGPVGADGRRRRRRARPQLLVLDGAHQAAASRAPARDSPPAAGALLAYDWRYFVAVVVVGLAVIALTRYMMAGQVAAAVTLPIAALVLGSPDWPFALAMGRVVYAAHHKRFMGMLQGKEPKLYINDRMGPRG